MMENKTPDEIEKEMMEHEQLHDDEIKENINKESTRKIKTVAEIEQEIREKEAAKLAEESHDVTEKHQPEVTKLKKSAKDNFLKKILFVAVAVIIVAIAGLKIYQKYKAPPKEETDKTIKTKEATMNKRNNLGQEVDPFRTEEPEQPTVEDRGNDNPFASSGTGTTPQTAPVAFSRALAVTAEGGQAGSNTRTRKEEKAFGTVSSESSLAQTKDEAGNDSESEVTAVKRIPYNPDLYIPENTPISCALTRRFVSDVAGKLQCVLTDDVYSASKKIRLLDKGSTASLVYKTGMLNHGQARVFVMATKIRTQQPPFMDIPLVDTDAAGELGEAGVDGWIDTHFKDRFLGAAMLGMIPDIANAATDNVASTDRNTDYTQNSREAFAELAKTAFENSVNIPPTIYKNQGEIITLITGRDIDFSKVYTLKYRGK
ncbi:MULTISPECIES: VirB10/TraB/TrbI family type IV secretion system protein [Enterobacteriaceae]|jgi:type IV secretion system protein VirB10|nr:MULTISPECIES: VirB10/TraB/TrbI family type IV secretion system protein [Enterobacteriaceae]MCM8198243.1 conjugal transfer protein TrbI [Enterobacter hormaechei]MDF3706068.1 VirB10/TraB/TrbI family type IV secretion system protein [Enterobacter hormaechei]MED8499515.1 VirB10/TraB/TrbI family type IV secretion system protein [Escherichia coli]UTO78334.1 conjugal transfer protein TrbI [Escherichia coli]UTP10964.1 conjugal transfer protein TrbI [Escherichia coli]